MKIQNIKSLKPKSYKPKPKPGFTLIEILIASFIFLVAVLAGTAVFSATVGTKSKVEVFWATQEGGRYGMELMIREIKDFTYKSPANTIKKIPDLGSSDPIADELEIEKDGQEIKFKLERVTGLGSPPPMYYRLIKEVNSASQIITADNIQVTSLKFTGPFDESNNYQLTKNFHPYIGIEMTIKNRPDRFRAKETDTLILRTVVSLRNYNYKFSND